VEETGYVAENVATGEETAENLGIEAVNPFAAELKCVLAFDEGEIVAEIGAPENFINGGFEEERLAKAK